VDDTKVPEPLPLNDLINTSQHVDRADFEMAKNVKNSEYSLVSEATILSPLVVVENLKPLEQILYKELRSFNNNATDTDSWPGSISKLLFRVASDNHAWVNLEGKRCMPRCSPRGNRPTTTANFDPTSAITDSCSSGLRRVPKQSNLAILGSLQKPEYLTDDRKRTKTAV
jgi:hypothetical protein